MPEIAQPKLLINLKAFQILPSSREMGDHIYKYAFYLMTFKNRNGNKKIIIPLLSRMKAQGTLKNPWG
jgi:hypothetical protein